MSFGWSVGDTILLTQLAWKTFQNSRKACGEHHELTCEVSSLYVVLQRLQKEVARSDSPINRPGDTCREELEGLVAGCHRVLEAIDQTLEKYSTLREPKGSGRKTWQRIRFGNDIEVLHQQRAKIARYTSAMSLFVTMASAGSIGMVGKKMDQAGGDLQYIKRAVDSITSHQRSKDNHESSIGSALTAYSGDDKAVWKEFRRELIKEGFSSSILSEHKDLIKAYVTELGRLGLMDEEPPRIPDNESHDQEHDMSDDADTSSIDSCICASLGVPATAPETSRYSFLTIPSLEWPDFGLETSSEAPAVADIRGTAPGPGTVRFSLRADLEEEYDAPAATRTPPNAAAAILFKADDARRETLYATAYAAAAKAARERVEKEYEMVAEATTTAKVAALVPTNISFALKAAPEPVKFEDATGRKHTFPFHTCEDWKGMEHLILEIFLHNKVYGPLIAEGRYDLISPHDGFIPKDVWEIVVRPGWKITMQMWPFPDTFKKKEETTRGADVPVVYGVRASARTVLLKLPAEKDRKQTQEEKGEALVVFEIDGR